MKAAIVALSLLAFACGDDSHEHGEVHVQITQAPPATATVGTAFNVSWMVHNDTHDELHHSELRYCEGADVADCGMGATDSYTSVTGTNTAGTFEAAVTIDTAGAFTLVAWCHVGEDPHLSDIFNIDAQ